MVFEFTFEKCVKPSHAKTWENNILDLDKGKLYAKVSDRSSFLNTEETEAPVLSAEVRKIPKTHHEIEHRAWSQKVLIKSWLHRCMTLGDLFSPSELSSSICQLELSTQPT